MRRTGSQEGTVSSLVAVLAIGIVAMAGLAYDGGAIVAAQTRARDLAGAAARAGAQSIDLASVHAGHTGLDTDTAIATAEAFLTGAGVDGQAHMDGTRLQVTVALTQPLRLLPLPERHIEATATATIVSDVLMEGPG